MKKTLITALIILFSTHFISAQEEKKIDSLSNDVIQTTYKDAPENVDGEEKINLRMDIGIGTDASTGIYFGIEEVF